MPSRAPVWGVGECRRPGSDTVARGHGRWGGVGVAVAAAPAAPLPARAAAVVPPAWRSRRRGCGWPRWMFVSCSRRRRCVCVCVCVCVHVYGAFERVAVPLDEAGVCVRWWCFFFYAGTILLFFFFFAALRVVWMPAAPRLATGGVLPAAAAMALECVLADACLRSPPPREASSLAAARGNIRCRRLSHLLVRCAGDGRHPWAAGDRHPHGRVAVVAGVRCGSCSPR